MRKRMTFLLTCLCLVSWGQSINHDTLLVRTEKNPFGMNRFYVVDGNKEMKVHFSDNKCDTTFYPDICEATLQCYKKEMKLIELRKKPINKVNADEAFKYFEMGETIVHVTERLKGKKIHVTPTGYKVAFPDCFTKKQAVLTFSFVDGKLSSISRSSSNRLPTNDVWTAFQLMELKDCLHDLEKVLKKK